MAYQAGASLGKFWDAMLELRSQRMKEQLAQQAQSNAMLEFGAGLGGMVAQGISKGMVTRGENAMYNQAMNQGMGGGTVPRAEAVGGTITPEQRASAMKQFGGPTQPHTGGKQEMAMLMEMQKAAQADIAAKSLADYRKMATAKQAWSMAPDLNKKFNTTNAYTKQMDVLNESMTKSLETRNQEMYNNTAGAMTSLHEAYTQTNPNTKTPPPQIPPFIHPDDLRAIGEAQRGISGLQSQLGGMKEEPGWFDSIIPKWIPQGAGIRAMGGGNKDQMDALKAEILEKQRALKGLPGASEYFKSQGASTGNKPGQIVNGWPLWKRKVHSDGRAIIWNGTEWMPEK